MTTVVIIGVEALNGIHNSAFNYNFSFILNCDMFQLYLVITVITSH